MLLLSIRTRRLPVPSRYNDHLADELRPSLLLSSCSHLCVSLCHWFTRPFIATSPYAQVLPLCISNPSLLSPRILRIFSSALPTVSYSLLGPYWNLNVDSFLSSYLPLRHRLQCPDLDSGHFANQEEETRRRVPTGVDDNLTRHRAGGSAVL